MLIIRKLNEEKLSALGDTAALNALLPETPEEALKDGAVVFVMQLDGKAVGALMMDSIPEDSRPPFLRVRMIAVLPELRRHGLGRMLMCTAAGEAAGRQVWFLGCVPEMTEEAQAFFAAMHFRAGVRPGALLLDLSDVEGMRHG